MFNWQVSNSSLHTIKKQNSKLVEAHEAFMSQLNNFKYQTKHKKHQHLSLERKKMVKAQFFKQTY